MEVRTQKPNQKFTIDSTNFLVVPAAVIHDDEGISAIYDTMALLPEDKFVDEVAKSQNQVSISRNLKKKCFKLKRTVWLEQLVQQYFFERILSRRHRTDDVVFLERKILAEIFSIASGNRKSSMENSISEEDTAKKAITYIESNLFSNLETESIARQVGVGVATLFRQFKKDIGVSPYAYIKRRRLEEAMRLLKLGKYSVSEVALLVGYENFGAFTDAFKAKYKKVPSSV